jgi:hypothetical protein
MKPTQNNWTPLHMSNKPLIPKYEIKLEARVKELIKDDPRVASYYIECFIDKMITVDLATGFNFEGRESFIAYGLKEFKQMLKCIKAGNPSDQE